MTILPLIVTFFGGSALLVGFYSALLRGGGIFFQLYGAYRSQEKRYVMPSLRLVFLVRFLAWLSIGLIILFVHNQSVALLLLGIALFIFSGVSGFGVIYFKEILAKIFTHKFRGKSMGKRQFFAGIGAIFSGLICAFVLQNFEEPFGYAYLFIGSAFLMSIGLLTFATIKEPQKEKITPKAQNFFAFIGEVKAIFSSDSALRVQIGSLFLSFSGFISTPFVILDIKERFVLEGTTVGLFISILMLGGVVGSLVWGKLSSKGFDKEIVLASFGLHILTFSLLFIAQTLWVYMLIFFLFGAGMDGFRLAYQNLLLIIAPEEKRLIYLAIQSKILSIGMFFPIIGGAILSYSNYTTLYSTTVILLLFGLRRSLKIVD